MPKQSNIISVQINQLKKFTFMFNEISAKTLNYHSTSKPNLIN